MTNPAWRRRLVAGTRVVGPICNSVLADWGYEPVKIRIFNNRYVPETNGRLWYRPDQRTVYFSRYAFQHPDSGVFITSKQTLMYAAHEVAHVMQLDDDPESIHDPHGEKFQECAKRIATSAHLTTADEIDLHMCYRWLISMPIHALGYHWSLLSSI